MKKFGLCLLLCLCLCLSFSVLASAEDTLDYVTDNARILTEEQAACHPMRNYITRAVGTDDTLDVDMITIPRMNGDRWIICSDGLYGQISKQELEETAKIADLEDAADKLLELALEHGGRDNITLILMQDESTAEEHETAGNTENEPAEDVAPEDADQEGVTEE